MVTFNPASLLFCIWLYEHMINVSSEIFLLLVVHKLMITTVRTDCHDTKIVFIGICSHPCCICIRYILCKGNNTFCCSRYFYSWKTPFTCEIFWDKFRTKISLIATTSICIVRVWSSIIRFWSIGWWNRGWWVWRWWGWGTGSKPVSNHCCCSGYKTGCFISGWIVGWKYVDSSMAAGGYQQTWVRAMKWE